MSRLRLSTLPLAVSVLLLSACGQSNLPESDKTAQPPAASPPVQAGIVAAPVVAPEVQARAVDAVATQALASPANSNMLEIQGFSSQVPASWTPTQLSSPMRVAQFALPPATGLAAGEVAIFFFRSGQGGSNEANIERWSSEFSTADGKPVAAKVSTSKSDGIELTLVELQGSYARGVGMGTTDQAKPDQTLMVAILTTAVGRITLQMYGPSRTVAAQRDNFLKFAKGFRSA